jgi:tRNA A-37 threonylcarbamoyl transferase component Bud32
MRPGGQRHDPNATLPLPPSLPYRFGKYRLVEKLAEGGMGVVFRAEELSEDGARVVRTVALKRIKRELVGTLDAAARFEREIAAAKKLDHVGIVPIFESGEENGEHYFTMPLVKGGNLHDHVQGSRPRFSVRQAAALARQVAETVQYAHEQGVVHRDVKPHNVLLQEVNSSADLSLSDTQLSVTPRLTDFGLARLTTAGSGPSIFPGQPFGTPGYMPPEQAKGLAAQIGPRSDVYGVGAVLYALLVGRPPFPRKEAGIDVTIREVIDCDPIPPRTLNREVPADLEAICLKCLEKDPAHRYASAGQLAEALDDFLNGRPRIRHTPHLSAWGLRRFRRLGRAARKHPVRVGYLAASAAALLALGVVLLSSWWGRTAEVGRAVRAADAAAAAGRRAEAEGKPTEALSHYTLASEKYARALALARGRGKADEARLGLAEVNVRRSALERAVHPDKWDEAKRPLEDALKHLEGASAGVKGQTRYRKVLAEAHHQMAETCATRPSQANLEKAREHYQQALPIREQLVEEASSSPGDLPGALRDLARNHGYLGDVQLDLKDYPGALWSYREAKRLRKEVVELTSAAGDARATIDAHCLHARDFGNLASYYERLGEPEKALELSRERLAYYQSPAFRKAHREAGWLPADFYTEPTNIKVAIATLELDLARAQTRAGRQAVAAAITLLQEAIEEYGALGNEDGGAGRKANEGLRTSIAQAQVILGKGLALAGKDEEAHKALTAARAYLYARTENARGSQDRDVLYGLAVAWAWSARLADRQKQLEKRVSGEERALQNLNAAVKAGYRNLAVLRREAGFEPLRKRAGEDGPTLQKIEKRLETGP